MYRKRARMPGSQRLVVTIEKEQPRPSSNVIVTLLADFIFFYLIWYVFHLGAIAFTHVNLQSGAVQFS